MKAMQQERKIQKSSLSAEVLRQWYWHEEKSIPEIARMTGISKHALYELMCKFNIPRRNLTQSNYAYYSKIKSAFRVKEVLTSEEEKLKIAGIMLYWAEGARRGYTVDFVNSNPEMIKIFLKFLREICGVDELRLRVYLYHYGEDHDVEAVKVFWSDLTRIPLSQFSRPYVRQGNPHKSGRIMPHGLIHIRYSDKRLLQLIQKWIEEYISTMNRAGTQVANGEGL